MYSERGAPEDFYDGLIDITSQASFITISWTQFHDHDKTSLISSNDNTPADTVIRVTYHHNFFYKCNSRLPSIRFGKAHIFNNYYYRNGSGISTRMGACVRVEHNYFEMQGNAVRVDQSIEQGGMQLIDNVFVLSNHASQPTCELPIPYDYESVLDDAEDIPHLIRSTFGNPASLSDRLSRPGLQVYPNPATDHVIVALHLQRPTRGELVLRDALGRSVAQNSSQVFVAGEQELRWELAPLPPGMYYLHFLSEDGSASRPLVIR